MEQERQLLQQRVLEAQREIFFALQQAAWSAWRNLDLTMVQMRALYALAHNGTMTVSALAEELDITKPAASILLDKLVQLGYVERSEDSDDRRRSLLSLSGDAEALLARLHAGGRNLMIRRLGTLDTDALVRLAEQMDILAELIRKTDEPPDAVLDTNAATGGAIQS